jgi:hypothetical protein
LFADGAKGSAAQVWRTSDPKTFIVARRASRSEQFVEQVVVMDTESPSAIDVLSQSRQPPAKVGT